MKVIPPDDGGPVHLQLGHHTGEDTAADGHLGEVTWIISQVNQHDATSFISHPSKKTFMNVPSTPYLSWSVINDYLSGEGTLFVDVVSHTSLSWGLEA